jgi:hypothetical protein
MSIITKATLIAIVIAALAVFIPVSVSAQAEGSAQNGVEAARGDGVPGELFGDAGIVTTITNLLLFVAGALAVIMIIIGGVRYATSGGNASNVTAAKNTVLYAIVGLIIAFLAFAAVNFILGTLAGGTSGGSGFTNV